MIDGFGFTNYFAWLCSKIGGKKDDHGLVTSNG